MSASLSAIQNNYIQNFPAEVPFKAAQSFIVTAAIKVFARFPSNVAVAGGTLAATSTIIEAVTRPIIKAIFPKNPNIAQSIQIVMPKMIALNLAASMAPWFGVVYEMTSFLIPCTAWIVLNDEFYERNEGMVEVL